MASIGQDSYDWGYSDGKAEGMAQGIIQGKAEGMAQGKAEGELINASRTVVSLVNDKGWSLEDALSFVTVSDGLRGRLEEEVRKRLN